MAESKLGDSMRMRWMVVARIESVMVIWAAVAVREAGGTRRRLAVAGAATGIEAQAPVVQAKRTAYTERSIRAGCAGRRERVIEVEQLSEVIRPSRWSTIGDARRHRLLRSLLEFSWNPPWCQLFIQIHVYRN
jgi:hypothetical protein